MTPELQKYYEDRLAMMGTKAWADLMEDVSKMLESTNRIEGIPDEKTLHFRQGEINIMRWMLALKQVSDDAYEELQNESNV